MAVATITVSLMLSAFVAYGATRLRFRGKTMLVASMLFAYMFPPLMLAIPMAATFRTIGLTDTLWGAVDRTSRNFTAASGLVALGVL
jgi:ABC-type glycerol-3-phosphate transport system permease component